MLIGEKAREAVRVAPPQNENHAIEADVSVEPCDVAGTGDFARHRSDLRERFAGPRAEGPGRPEQEQNIGRPAAWKAAADEVSDGESRDVEAREEAQTLHEILLRKEEARFALTIAPRASEG